MFDKLLNMARAAQKQSYSPYSKFKVGASLLSTSGKYYQGCSIEFCSFSLTLCAEASVISSMVASGERGIRSLLVVGGDDKFCFPCGSCRQQISEFSTCDTDVIVVDGTDQYKVFKIEELLPNAFKFMPRN